MSARPRCPSCGRSSGLGVEATVAAQWSRGAWRAVSDIEINPDATMSRDYCEWIVNAEDAE